MNWSGAGTEDGIGPLLDKRLTAGRVSPPNKVAKYLQEKMRREVQQPLLRQNYIESLIIDNLRSAGSSSVLGKRKACRDYDKVQIRDLYPMFNGDKTPLD